MKMSKQSKNLTILPDYKLSIVSVLLGDFMINILCWHTNNAYYSEVLARKKPLSCTVNILSNKPPSPPFK